MTAKEKEHLTRAVRHIERARKSLRLALGEPAVGQAHHPVNLIESVLECADDAVLNPIKYYVKRAR